MERVLLFRVCMNNIDPMDRLDWDSWEALPDKVAFLSRPEIYPERTTEVEIVETHMSWVFLTDDAVYKLKKPARFELVDLVTLEKRKRNCEAELRWNRRLAPDVYLGMVPLGLDEEGHLVLCRDAGVVDWLVKMRRLPSHRMLDRMIAGGEVEPEDIRGVADTLATFYRKATAVEIDVRGYQDRFLDEVREIVAELRERSPIEGDRIEAISESIQGFVRDRASELSRRVEDGWIVDGHGDLRPEHVCLLPEPVIIDCVEFNRELRLVDPVDELSFLALECELGGGPSFIEPILFERYVATTGDDPLPSLAPFYKTYRAFQRARIAIWHLRGLDVKHGDRWVAKAERYLEAAERFIQRKEARR